MGVCLPWLLDTATTANASGTPTRFLPGWMGVRPSSRAGLFMRQCSKHPYIVQS